MTERKLVLDLATFNINFYAERYDYEEPPIIEKKGYLTKEEFEKIVIWKLKSYDKWFNIEKKLRKSKKNTESFVRDVTGASFSAEDEHAKIEILTVLDMVGYPVASALLHFGCDERYPILDARTLNALWGMKRSDTQYNFALWNDYMQTCKRIAKDDNNIRHIDKALWVYGEDNKRQNKIDEQKPRKRN